MDCNLHTVKHSPIIYCSSICILFIQFIFVSFTGDTIYLSGLDIVDGTPVLDIKPYISSYDQPSKNDYEFFFLIWITLLQNNCGAIAVFDKTIILAPGKDDRSRRLQQQKEE